MNNAIERDTGWVVDYESLCYVSKYRTVIFKRDTAPELVKQFVDSYNAGPRGGQTDRMWIDENNDLMVRGRFILDSGD